MGSPRGSDSNPNFQSMFFSSSYQFHSAVKPKDGVYQLLIGNRALLEQEKVFISKEVDVLVEHAQLSGDTVVMVACDGEVVCVAAVADKVRDSLTCPL